MAKEKKLTAAEQAEVKRRKANDYMTPGWEKRTPTGLGNQVKTIDDKKTMERVAAVQKSPKGTKPNLNERKETLEALRALGKVDEKDYRRRKKAM